MSEELKACPFCGENDAIITITFDGLTAGAVVCKRCFYDLMRPNGKPPVPVVWNTRPIEDKLQAELARRDEKIEELQFQLDSLCPCGSNPQDEHYLLVDEMCPIHGHPNHEIARRDEIIKRLKEDAERLFVHRHYLEGYRVWQCEYCGVCTVIGDTEKHKDDCSITLHRALMKELK